MTLLSILAGEFKLDGGAMFGVVPKTIWNQNSIADEQNLVTLAMRCLFIEVDNKKILIDTGIGNKLPTKIASHYQINSAISLASSLKKHGISCEEITDVILSHLHLDHAGGAIVQTNDGKLVPTFARANYWTSSTQWKWATENPNPRERASFRPENLEPLHASQQLQFIEPRTKSIIHPCIELYFADGHTKGMVMPLIHYKGKKIIFTADLLPSIHHIPIAYIPSYDIFPLDSMQEKQQILNLCEQENHIIFLDHDNKHECCTVKKNEKGIIALDQTFPLGTCL